MLNFVLELYRKKVNFDNNSIFTKIKSVLLFMIGLNDIREYIIYKIISINYFD